MELHIVLGYSAAGTIRSVLVGRNAKVVRFSDNLSYGPIDPPDSVKRRGWIEENIGFDNPDITGDEENFWPQIFGKVASRVVWVSRRSADEYCAFLEYLRRLDDLPTHVIDTTEARGCDGKFHRSTGSIPNAQIPDLLDSVRLLTVEERASYRALWQRLQAENSDLRTVTSNLTLQSAPMSFYDEALLSFMGEEWKPMARVLGDVLQRENVHDAFLVARLYELEGAGFLVMRDGGRRLPDVRLVRP